jgi:molybdate transport system ATP-binding protein
MAGSAKMHTDVRYLRQRLNQLLHTAFYISGSTNNHWLVQQLMQYRLCPAMQLAKGKSIAVFNTARLNFFIKEELQHDSTFFSADKNNRIASSSNGEQRLALLQYLLAQQPACIIIDGVFDSLDTTVKQKVSKLLQHIAAHTLLVQIISRKEDCLPMIQEVYSMVGNTVAAPQTYLQFTTATAPVNVGTRGNIPAPPGQQGIFNNPLIQLTDVSVSFGERKILNNINWTINKGECWQLKGPNGSGKTTLLALITGDNVKGYGQNLLLFGRKKGSGETVWDIKQHIGYFASYMLQQFETTNTARQMIAGGFFDSIGLYSIPGDKQWQLANQWMVTLGLADKSNTPFLSLTAAEQRLVLLARAMVKHPPLLILDEPTTGLDDTGAKLFTSLVNDIAAQTSTAIIYVSHRQEAELNPSYILELVPGADGSAGYVRSNIKNAG